MSIDRPRFILLEVEDNNNCPGLPLMISQELDQPTEVTEVRIAGHHGPEELRWVTVWQSDAGAAHAPPLSTGLGLRGTEVSIVRQRLGYPYEARESR